MKENTTIAVDLAKNVFEIAVSHQPGRVSERHRLSRSHLAPFFANRPPATVVLEACGSAHHWARLFAGFGHRVVLLPAQYVRPYVRRNKTDRADAAGLLEAWRCADLRPVPVKTLEQQALLALHRTRSAWMATRTARLNLLRGVLRELGQTIPVGARQVLPKVTTLIEDADSNVPMSLRDTLATISKEIRDLEQRVRTLDAQIVALGKGLAPVARLQTIRGIGPLTSTALLAVVGDISRFRSGRQLASYLGLTPREHSSGERRQLGRISKRGDSYLRMLLIHGARAVLWAAKSTKHPDRLQAWALRIEQLRGHNKAAVALANKLARVAWAVWRRERDYQPAATTQAA